ncbi:hypothetical protein FSP39_007780 [Pinctada imbricata]|uniref:Protein phosphatase 1 regulatory subunit 16A n=1 Tax=Pinctada imbricata TaxID=66713 RepID=A0AA88XI17_PINIB|nr:hypothetical protein FSP39_007780 [Pinctada imbricata]
MADHQDLVAEIPSVEKMGTQERLKHAKKRRSHQLKKWANYEKQLEKESTKKTKKGQNQSKQKHRRTKNTRVRFKGNIMLLESAARNDLEDVKRLLSAGVNPDVTNEDGLTALHQCCIDDNEEMLKLLLEFGALVNARDSELWTPLHAAATCGHVHLCKHLIDKGAELLAVNADGNMPYDICEDEVALDYIETEMAKRGITQEEIDETRLIPEKQMLNDLKKVANRHGDLEFRTPEGATPLHIAAANGYLEVAEFLLDHHVSVDVRDGDSWQPIHAAACWLQPEILEILVKNGADIDAKTKNGETAFDLCEDAEIKQKILDMRDEIEAIERAGGIETVYEEQNIPLDRTASIRRSSMRGEKNPLFMKEAKEEALHFGWRSDEDITEDEKENSTTAHLEEVEIIVDEDEFRPLREIEKDDELKIKELNKVVRTSSFQKKGAPPPPRVTEQKSSDHDITNQSPSQRRNSPREQTNSEKRVSNSPPSQSQTDRSRSAGSQSQQDRPRGPGPQNMPERPRGPGPDERRRSDRQDRRHEQTPSPKASSNSYQPGNPAYGGGGSTSPQGGRYPSGGLSITLSDLKRQRAESRSRENSVTDISSQVQDLFISSLNSNDSKKYSSSSLPDNDKAMHNNKNGHNTNNNIVHAEKRYRFKDPGNSPLVGGEEKQGCCTIM